MLSLRAKQLYPAPVPGKLIVHLRLSAQPWQGVAQSSHEPTHLPRGGGSGSVQEEPTSTKCRKMHGKWERTPVPWENVRPRVEDTAYSMGPRKPCLLTGTLPNRKPVSKPLALSRARELASGLHLGSKAKLKGLVTCKGVVQGARRRPRRRWQLNGS